MKPKEMLRLIFAIVVLVILWNIGIIVLDEVNKVNSIQDYPKQKYSKQEKVVQNVTTSTMELQEWLTLERQPKPETTKSIFEELRIMAPSAIKADEIPQIATLLTTKVDEDSKIVTQSAFKMYRMLKSINPSAIKVDEKARTTTQSAIEMDEKLPVNKEKSKKKVTKKSKKKAKRVKKYIGRANWVNFRNAPNLESEVKEVLKRGTNLEIISKKKNWSKVKLESGEKGYVYNKYITKNKEEFVVQEKKYFCGVELQYSATYNVSDNRLNRRNGVVYYNGHRETYYSQRVLPGGGLDIPGRHVAEDGTVRDGDGYICVSADLNFLARGSLLMLTLGPAKVYDTGCAYGTIDVYVNW